eukprot:scaffold279956_cov26-Prasinocladus_malaysianus.AAC.1
MFVTICEWCGLTARNQNLPGTTTMTATMMIAECYKVNCSETRDGVARLFDEKQNGVNGVN